jgi:glycosyltransferase involved in cell wall biosynthesis
MPNSVPLSVVVITFNEERNIGRCLASVRGIADEVVVVDSFSTDRTEEICRQYGATFLQHPFEGHIQQKNYALSRATHPYVLSLDADEALSPAAATVGAGRQKPLGRRRLRDGPPHQLLRPLDQTHRLVPRPQNAAVRQAERPAGAAPTPTTGWNWSPAPPSKRIGGDLLHYSYHSVSQHIRQLNYFTDIGARVAFEKAKRRRCPRCC